MSTKAHENKEISLFNKSAPDRERFLTQFDDELPEIEHFALNSIAVGERRNQNSVIEHSPQTGDELDELMIGIMNCHVEIQQFERDSQNDMSSLVQCELDNSDAHFNNWVTEMEVMFMMFVHEAEDIVHHIMRDQLSLAESIEYMLEEASTDLYQSLNLDNSQLENDLINNLSISDGLVPLAVRTLHRDLVALTSSHDAIFDDVVAIELSCEKTEFEICRRGFLDNMVTSAVGCLIQHKADQNDQHVESVSKMHCLYKTQQTAIGKTDAVQLRISKTDGVQATNSKGGFIKPKNKNPLRTIMARVRSAAVGLRRILFACVGRQDVHV